jgi:hypothetical protein
MLRVLIALACLALCAGCQPKNKAASDTGGSGTASGTGAAGGDDRVPATPPPPPDVQQAADAPPEGWPASLPLFPKAQYTGGSKTVQDNNVKLAVNLVTEADAETVVRFYADKAAAAEFELTAEDRGTQFITSNYQSPTHSLSVSVAAGDAPRTVALILLNSGGTPVAPPVVDYAGQDKLPAGFPEIVTVYPGATVVSATHMGGIATLSMRTTAAPDDVQQHYRERFQQAGYLPASSTASAETSTGEYHGPGGMVIVSCGPVPPGAGGTGGSTSVLVTLSPLPPVPDAR